MKKEPVKLIHVKPLRGLKVPNPAADGAHLPEAGEVVEDSSYWRRRGEAKEVEISEVKKSDAAVAPEVETKQNEGSKVDKKAGGKE